MIRKATREDLCRIAEIFVFNNRINYYPIFRDPEYSFGYLQVDTIIEDYFGTESVFNTLYVSEEAGIVNGFAEIRGNELGKLYVDPFFQGKGIGALLLNLAVEEFGVNYLWTLEKNERARRFYNRYGFVENGEKVLEEDTTEYLLKLVRN